jgi:hypothetical protein
MARITILLNTHNFAAAQFFNHQANSACVFDGQLLFATSDGVFKSSGDNDGYETVGEAEVPIPIDAHVVLPTSDFGYKGQKSPRSMILGGNFDGQMQVSVTDEQGATRDYPTPILDGDDGVKIALRTDQRSRYHTIKIANVDGADFSLESVDMVYIPGPERRR